MRVYVCVQLLILFPFLSLQEEDKQTNLFSISIFQNMCVCEMSSTGESCLFKHLAKSLLFFFLVCFCDKVLDNINWKIRQGERVASPRRANGIRARACSLPPIRLWLTPDSIFNQDQCKTTLLLLLSHTWRSSTILRLKTSFFYFLHLPATVRIIPDSFILQPS